MKVENIGEIFIDGRITNLDNATVSEIDSLLEKNSAKENEYIDALNNILTAIQ